MRPLDQYPCNEIRDMPNKKESKSAAGKRQDMLALPAATTRPELLTNGGDETFRRFLYELASLCGRKSMPITLF